ncbi:phage minor capsid protein [Acidaminobacterium chupaoyuni]
MINPCGIFLYGSALEKSTSLEAAVRRSVMGGLGLMQEQITQVNHDAMGCDGWEISAHAASAPDHEPIQGKQYSDAEYTALNNSLVRRIGTLNCGHAAFPIILGVSRPQYTSEELQKFREDNAAGIDYQGKHYTMYEATQMQRRLESSMRTQKRRILGDEATQDKEKLQINQIRLRRLREEYSRFSKAVGLRTQQERAEVAGFGAGQAKRAEKTVEKYSEVRYNQDGTIVVTDDWTRAAHISIPKKYIPNAVVDTVSRDGLQHDRTLYGADGIIKTQIHGGNHGNPKKHPYGKHGEHVHDYTWAPGSEKPDKPARNPTDADRVHHADILGGEDSDS